METARYNRGAGRTRADQAAWRPDCLHSLFNRGEGGGGGRRDPLEDPGVRGAVLKIAYESAHLRLGDALLADPAAAAAREALAAFANKETARARELAAAADVRAVDIDAFHAAARSPRREFVKRAIAGKSCLNSIWLVPFKPDGAGGRALAVVIDIEGLPPCFAVVGASAHGVESPELIFPRV